MKKHTDSVKLIFLLITMPVLVMAYTKIESSVAPVVKEKKIQVFKPIEVPAKPLIQPISGCRKQHSRHQVPAASKTCVCFIS